MEILASTDDVRSAVRRAVIPPPRAPVALLLLAACLLAAACLLHSRTRINAPANARARDSCTVTFASTRACLTHTPACTPHLTSDTHLHVYTCTTHLTHTYMYTESLRDLLSPPSDVTSPKKLDLLHDGHGGVRVTNLAV